MGRAFDERDQTLAGGFAVLDLRAMLARIDDEHAFTCHPAAGDGNETLLDVGW